MRRGFAVVRAGDATDMTNPGIMYENGRAGLPRYDAQAVIWYRKAANWEAWLKTR